MDSKYGQGRPPEGRPREEGADGGVRRGRRPGGHFPSLPLRPRAFQRPYARTSRACVRRRRAACLDCSSYRSGGDRSATVAAHLDGGGFCVRSLDRVRHRLGGASSRGKLVLRSCAFVRPSVRTAVPTPRAPNHSRCPGCSALRSNPAGHCLLRVFMPPLFDAVSYGCGLVGVPFTLFALATALGEIPKVGSFTYIGTAAGGVSSWLTAWVLLGPAIGVLAVQVIRSRLARRTAKTQAPSQEV